MDHLSDRQIYEKYASELIRFATFLVGPSEAEDVLSEAVLRSMASAHWSEVVNHRAYLYRAVLNQARAERRSAERRVRRELRVAGRDVLEVVDPRPEVSAAVASLAPRQRAVVYLTYWDDLDPTTIAHLLGISDGSVRRHLARARAHLRRTLS